jgi:beta-lactam-binding protein with PASTA domain
MTGPGTNLWSADGNYQWSADGFTGWSADGYEPVSEGVATNQLAAFGVNVGALTYAYDPLVPAGYVITGFVPFLSTTFAGQYIPLKISNGPAPATTALTVPNVVGKFYSDAQLALLQAGFLIAPPQFVLSSTVKPQYVISQSVAPGTQFTQQTQVTIVVSGFPVTNQPGVVVPVP